MTASARLIGSIGARGEGQVVAHAVDITADAAEIGLHVDNDQRGVSRPQVAVVGPGIGICVYVVFRHLSSPVIDANIQVARASKVRSHRQVRNGCHKFAHAGGPRRSSCRLPAFGRCRAVPQRPCQGWADLGTPRQIGGFATQLGEIQESSGGTSLV
jgi:hypothetical protein